MSIAFSNVTIVLAFMLIIPLIIFVYVYRDAKRRGMNAILWALIAAIAPTLIGLIVYLLVRGSYSDLRCPVCDTPVQEQFVVCPKCGTKLHASCSNCAAPVEPDWKVCPKCAQPLTDAQADVHPPVRAKDHTIGKVLAIVIIIPILLIGLLVLSFSVSSNGGAVSYASDSFDAYFSTMEETPEQILVAEKVQEWLDGLELNMNRAYALRNDFYTGAGNEHYYLIYVPGAGEQVSSGIGQSRSIFGMTVTLELHSTGNGDALIQVVSSAEKEPNLKIVLDGKRIPCDVTKVDYNPTRFYNEEMIYEVIPEAAENLSPERITIVKLVDSHNEGVALVEGDDDALDILEAIDSAPYLDLEHEIYGESEGSHGFDFKDGFDIVFEFKAYRGLESVLHCFAFEKNDSFYIIDDRPDHGRIIREIDEAFYGKLSALFE